jgi:hypothetical protein
VGGRDPAGMTCENLARLLWTRTLGWGVRCLGSRCEAGLIFCSCTQRFARGELEFLKWPKVLLVSPVASFLMGLESVLTICSRIPATVEQVGGKGFLLRSWGLGGFYPCVILFTSKHSRDAGETKPASSLPLIALWSLWK